MSVFFLGSWGMNRSAEQTNRPRTASRFTRFVCPALRFIPNEPRKQDTHSLNVAGWTFMKPLEHEVGPVDRKESVSPTWLSEARVSAHVLV